MKTSFSWPERWEKTKMDLQSFLRLLGFPPNGPPKIPKDRNKLRMRSRIAAKANVEKFGRRPESNV